MYEFIDSAPKLTPSLSQKTQIVGSPFNFWCAIEVGSLPVFFEWTKNVRAIKPGPDVAYKIESSKKSSTLNIDEIVRAE